MESRTPRTSRTDKGALRVGLLLKAFKKGKWHRIYCGSKKSMLRARLRSLPHQEWNEYSLRVTYGKARDAFGDMVSFTNEGHYKTKAGLDKALVAFTEKALVDEWVEKT